MSAETTTETVRTPEEIIDGHVIGIGTSTFYKGWYPGEDIDQSTDKVRGDLALQMLATATAKGFQVTVVDGGSAQAFKDALAEINGLAVSDEKERGMSGSRRQVLREVAAREGVKVVCWVEPEKISIVEDCLPEATRLILENKADIVIPGRDVAGFASYPGYQADFEQKANNKWNQLVKAHDLYPVDAPDLDMWIGPRFIKNDPELLELFMQKQEYERVGIAPSGDNDVAKKRRAQVYNPDLWAGAIFLPVMRAMDAGYRVIGVPVPYKHPSRQTEQELGQDGPEFKKKRELQYHNIIIATINEIRELEGNEKGRFKKAA
jgi:hypothetical protein